jgi:hypothetical protein
MTLSATLSQTLASLSATRHDFPLAVKMDKNEQQKCGSEPFPLAYIPQKGIFLTREHPTERREENRFSLALLPFPLSLARLYQLFLSNFFPLLSCPTKKQPIFLVTLTKYNKTMTKTRKCNEKNRLCLVLLPSTSLIPPFFSKSFTLLSCTTNLLPL